MAGLRTDTSRALRRVRERLTRGVEAVARSRSRAPEIAILVVNGFDRRGRWGAFNEQEAIDYPWIDLCLRQITRWSEGVDYHVYLWDNAGLSEHESAVRRYPRVSLLRSSDEGGELRHGPSLDRLRSEIRSETEFVVTIDSDSFPVRDGWLQNLTGRLTDEVALAGIWRDEMMPVRQPFVHPSCLVIRQSTLDELGTGFVKGSGTDVGARVTDAVLDSGKRISRLRRTNRWNPHFMMGGLYDGLMYHQGSGSRSPKFAVRSSIEDDEQIRQVLRNAAFSNLEDLVDVLAGDLEPGVVDGLDGIPTHASDLST